MTTSCTVVLIGTNIAVLPIKLQKAYVGAMVPMLRNLNRPSPKTLAAALTAAAGILIFWSMFRGVRMPGSYAMGHWLINYETGFIKRGMIGTLMLPFFHFKAPQEIRLIIQIISTATLFAMGITAVFAGRMLTRKEVGGGPILWLPFIAFCTSSFIVVASAMNGFFDRFLEITTLIGVFAVIRGRFHAVPFIAMFALSIHELFFVYGFPALALAVLMKLAEGYREGGLRSRQVAYFIGVTLLPSIVFYLSILLSQAGICSTQFDQLEENAAAVGVIDKSSVDFLVLFHLHHNLEENYEMQRYEAFSDRVFRKDIARNVFPTTLYLSFWIIALLVLARQKKLIVPALFAVAMPLAAHLVAWDTHRFTNFTIFQSFVVLFALGGILRPRVSAFPKLTVLAVLLFVPVFLNNILGTVGISKWETEAASVFALRRVPPLSSFAGKPRLFENSDFENGTLKNWQITEGAILNSPKKLYVREIKTKQQGAEGNRWYGTFDTTTKNKRLVGDAATGTLMSTPFVVAHNEIMFLVSGGANPKKTYVSLEVEGKEVYRVAGKGDDDLVPTSWDVSKFRGKSARIRIVDHTDGPWGHINADGFCYWPD